MRSGFKKRHATSAWTKNFPKPVRLPCGPKICTAAEFLLIELPPDQIEAPYPDAMIQYARIGEQACDSILGERA